MTKPPVVFNPRFKRPSEYTAERFCIAAMHPSVKKLAVRFCAGKPLIASDLVGDFIVYMLDKGHWQRWDRTGEPLLMFVKRFAYRFFKTRVIDSQRRFEVRVRHVPNLARYAVDRKPQRRAVHGSHTAIAKLRRFITPDLAETVDAVLRAGGNLTAAAVLLGERRDRVRGMLRQVRERAEAIGVTRDVGELGPVK